MERLNWNDYFMNIAVQVSLRSTCIRRRVGAVIVNEEHQILSTGYNGAPKGLPNCSDDPDRCYRCKHNIPSGEKLDLCYAQHAEVNALFGALKSGTSVNGSTIYVTTFPCSSCAKALIQAGIKHVYYIDNYTHEFTKMMFDEAGIDYHAMDGSVYRTPDIKGAESETINNLDNVDPLLAEIFKYPVGTEKFKENRHKIMKENGLFEKYNEMIFATEFHPPRELMAIDVYGEVDGNSLDKLLKPFVSNRADLEYTGGAIKQIVTCAVLYDPINDLFAFLKAKGDRLDGRLTLVQGHLAYNNVDKLEDSLQSILARNMSKELHEEIAKGFNPVQMSPIALIQSNDNKISEEHIGVVYIITGEIKKDKITSGEPDKHDVVCVEASSILDNAEVMDKLDTWCKKAVEHLIL